MKRSKTNQPTYNKLSTMYVGNWHRCADGCTLSAQCEPAQDASPSPPTTMTKSKTYSKSGARNMTYPEGWWANEADME